MLKGVDMLLTRLNPNKKLPLKVVATFGAVILAMGGAAACGSEHSEANSAFADSCGEAPGQFRSTHARTNAGAGAVSTSDPTASWAACTVLAEGGTAADGVIAAQLVLGLTEPQSSGPGGGALVVYYDGETGTSTGFDGTVFAPAEYEDDDSDASSVGVPRTLNLLRKLHEAHGSLPLQRLAEPAIKAAQEGFSVSDHLAESMQNKADQLEKGGQLQVLYGVDSIPEVGDRLTNPAYARTLKQWVDSEGEITIGAVEKLSAELAEQQPGPVSDRLARTWMDTRQQLPEPAEALCGEFNSWNLCGVGTNAVGTNVVLTALGILKNKDIARFTPYSNKGVPVAKSTAAHFAVEAERIAFADANAWMGDPGDSDMLQKIAQDYHNKIVTNDAFHQEMADRIHQKKSLANIEPTAIGNGQYKDFLEEGTSHISVKDTSGNAISMTTTLAREFGSGLTAGGFFLNNSLDNFSTGNAEEPNSPRPLTRPKTMMAPMIANKGNQDVVAFGSPGGNAIPSYNIKAALGMFAWGLNPRDAIRMPNFGATDRSGSYIESDTQPDGLKDMKRMSKRLKEWGHKVSNRDAMSGVGVVSAQGDEIATGADHRRGGVTLTTGSP